MKRIGNHIKVTLALTTLLVLSSCTRTVSFYPASLLVGEGSKSTVISTVLLKLPGKLIDAAATEMETHFQKDKQKHKKKTKQNASDKVLSLPIHTRIANPIPLKKDNKTLKATKASNNNSHTSTSGTTKLENDNKSNPDTKNQDTPICCRLM
ncbi:hypothetical protein PbJCM13498_15410 [Prolixibacter bellariivorans]|uniref:Lipoprotein n=1 Tax=Prolixibacter bellariivorans TaxID=314319 RepID=A0A5M4AYD0_9BACT|nr:hypothetical protein [Prolixibacter bellariivorans]GET32678.1 hypothetical protein PbJCM13498_15410 [Prolixibacter bellariivorans]